MAKEHEHKKIIMMTSKNQISKIDAFRYANWIPSRAEAIRRLLNMALASWDAEKEKEK